MKLVVVVTQDIFCSPPLDPLNLQNVLDEARPPSVLTIEKLRPNKSEIQRLIC